MMPRTLLVSLLTVILSFTARAQLHIIPVEYYNQGILIKMVAEGSRDSLNFLFDTGATQTAIDSATAVKAGIVADQTAMAAGVTGMQRIPMTGALAIQAGTAKLRPHPAILVNLSQLSSRYGKIIHGIIGYELLTNFIVRLDIDKQQLELYHSVKDMAPSVLGEKLSFSFSYAIPIPQAECSIRLKSGKIIKENFMFDSGALGVTALFNTGFSKQHDLISEAGNYSNDVGISLFNRTEKLVTAIDGLTIGSFAFGEMPVSALQAGQKAGALQVTNILGNAILYRFNMVFNYIAREIYLQPNKYFHEPFEFPVSGIKLSMQENRLIIDFVADGSPAAAAGIKPGVELLSVNGRVVTDLDVPRQLLNNPGKKISIVIKDGIGKKKKFRFRMRRYF